MLARLSAGSIDVVCFKSTPGLSEALYGKGDLDLFVPQRHRNAFRRAAYKSGFLEVFPNSTRTYPFVENFVGSSSTEQVSGHLHVHYEIVVGPDYAKNIVLKPEVVFSNKAEVLHFQNISLHTIHPVDELRLTQFRLLLKVRLRDFFQISNKLEGLINEMRSIGAANNLVVDESTRRVFGSALERRRVPLIGFLKLLRQNNGDFKLSLFRWVTLKRQEISARIKNRLLMVTKPQDTHMDLGPGSGQIICFVGCDGSGKSSLLEAAASQISRRLNIRKFHFGKPDNIFGYMHRIFVRVLPKINPEHIEFSEKRKRLFALPVFLNAIARSHLATKIQRQALAGKIVFVDRFYLAEIGLDGGRDISLIEHHFGRSSETYKKIESLYSNLPKPGTVLVIDAKIKNLLARRPDDDPIKIQNKHHLIQQFISKRREISTIESSAKKIFTIANNGDLLDAEREVIGAVNAVIYHD